jgi:hypothetical protein
VYKVRPRHEPLRWILPATEWLNDRYGMRVSVWRVWLDGVG